MCDITSIAQQFSDKNAKRIVIPARITLICWNYCPHENIYSYDIHKVFFLFLAARCLWISACPAATTRTAYRYPSWPVITPCPAREATSETRTAACPGPRTTRRRRWPSARPATWGRRCRPRPTAAARRPTTPRPLPPTITIRRPSTDTILTTTRITSTIWTAQIQQVQNCFLRHVIIPPTVNYRKTGRIIIITLFPNIVLHPRAFIIFNNSILPNRYFVLLRFVDTFFDSNTHLYWFSTTVHFQPSFCWN